jgi:hypothetical protein
MAEMQIGVQQTAALSFSATSPHEDFLGILRVLAAAEG